MLWTRNAAGPADADQQTMREQICLIARTAPADWGMRSLDLEPCNAASSPR
jgi:hypothetical protein